MTSPPVCRGEIWWVNLDPTQGSEIRKTRPCLIISSNVLNNLRKTVVVIPLSSVAKAHPPISISVPCQKKPSVAIIDQIRAVAKHRLKGKIDIMSNTDMKKILAALSEILEMP
ncbi:MAG: type II toxin-antitoxin system PemK/MazF family toxin [Mariprofundaceae bacterium]